MPIEIQGFTLVQTCGCCPEQYDVFEGEHKVGYLRARNGYFRADYPFAGGDTLYESPINGDGCFTDEDRARHLFAACCAIRKRLNQKPEGYEE